jgi:dUTP pyrophosphatase
MEQVRVLVRRLPNYPADWALPSYGTAGSAAVDLRNAGPAFELPSLGRQLVATGLAIALPPGMEAQIRPRSGLALNRGVSIINTPCTIAVRSASR